MILKVIPLLITLVWPLSPAAQRRPVTGTPPSRPEPASPVEPATAPGMVREAPLMQCPSVLGNGIKTQRLFCDILTGSDPAAGLRVSIPAHEGRATLLFILHNRQAQSIEPARGANTYARYTATLRVVMPNGTLLRQTVVQNEYRGPVDLVERIAGGPERGGVKAVAPTGSEAIAIELPPGATEVSLLGEKLTIERITGTEVVTTPGRPIAIVSQMKVEYRPRATSGTRRRS
jgi:hypothetical protein